MALLCHTKVPLLSLLLLLSISLCFTASLDPQLHTTRRTLLLDAEKQHQDKSFKKKTTTLQSIKNHTKLLKPTTTLSPKNQTKPIKSNINISTNKNQTKTINLTTKSNDNSPPKNLNSSITTKTKKLNITSKPIPSKLSPASIPTKKPLDLAKATNKTTTKTTKDKKQTKTTKADQNQTQDTVKKQKSSEKSPQQNKKPAKQTPASWIMEDEAEEDLVSEFTDLPNKFHRTLIPDLERISTTSKAYITKANTEITKNFKPYVGKKYAAAMATIVSCAFILVPLFLVSLLCNRIKAYFSLQKVLIFIQVYLSIYFTILCVSSLVTGTEPLRFLYSASRSTYLCLQVLQTLAYVFYLLLLLMHLVLVFSTECGLGSKFLGLGQVFVGFAVGLHYYVTVFHRVVLQQPPKTNWKVHGIYATCFLLICVCAGADRRKKAYVEDGGGEGKIN
ncbi:hypothetical protein RJT34_03304 [Clitoria ternatea]|uniref:Uncharacterized protein n=1 Tax=Clitoria ternatea TaxID=43366 RepID=A0AAN9KKJ9_CLITE